MQKQVKNTNSKSLCLLAHLPSNFNYKQAQKLDEKCAKYANKKQKNLCLFCLNRKNLTIILNANRKAKSPLCSEDLPSNFNYKKQKAEQNVNPPWFWGWSWWIFVQLQSCGGQHVAAQSLESSSNAAGHPLQHSFKVLPLIKANTKGWHRQLKTKKAIVTVSCHVVEV